MKLTLKIEDSTRFSQFLKKFSVVEDSLLLVLTPTQIKANTHTPDKSVVKSVTADINDVFSEVPTNMPSEVKIGVFLIDKLIQSFKFFGNTEFEFIINADDVNGEIVAVNVTMKNSSLNIKFPTASLTMFTQITDTMINSIANVADSVTDFSLNKEQQTKINSLFGIDVDYAKITFESSNNTLNAKGKNFNYVLDSTTTSKDNETSIFKHHYVFIDREDSTVYALDDKLIVKSDETDTLIVIGQAD